MRHRRKLLVLVVLVTIGTMAACTDSALRKASIAARDLALAVKAFQDAEIIAHQQGRVADDEHGRIQSLLIRVAEAGKELDADIRVLHSHPKAVVAFQAFDDSLGRLLAEGVIGIKNSQTKAELQLAFTSIRTLAAIIGAAIDAYTTTAGQGTVTLVTGGGN